MSNTKRADTWRRAVVGEAQDILHGFQAFNWLFRLPGSGPGVPFTLLADQCFCIPHMKLVR